MQEGDEATRTTRSVREVLMSLRSAAVDTGDDRTQVALDDVIDLIEARLRAAIEGRS